MIVYHGTDIRSAQNIKENGIDLARGDASVDNGRGFYTTPNREFAIRRAKSVTAAARTFRADNTLKPALLEIEIDETRFCQLCVREFSGCTYDWKEFILYNRIGKRFLHDQKIVSENHNLDLKYDIVLDETADAGVGSIVSRVRYKETRGGSNLCAEIGRIRRSDDVDWGRQVSFHSQRAVQLCIKSIRIIEV